MGAGMIIAIVILIAIIGGGIFAYMKKWFWFQKSGGGARSYTTIYSTGKKKGACNTSTDGTKGPASTKYSDCAAACDAVKAPAVCNGYDWDGTRSCTLYATLPTTANYVSGKKDECKALAPAK